MRFLILGCNGMAGHTISLYLKERGHDVFGFDRNASSLISSTTGDAMDAAFIENIIGVNKYDTIINCIGVLNQFAENNHALAAYLNGYFPHQLAKLTEGTDTQIIHMSTDCVFSGNKGQYTEDELRDGTTFYDRSKALGEIENAAVAVPGIEMCACIYDKDRERIVLIYQGKGVTTQLIRNTMKLKVPPYMLPNVMLEIQVMPKNQNGKIDRKALKAYYEEKQQKK